MYARKKAHWSIACVRFDGYFIVVTIKHADLIKRMMNISETEQTLRMSMQMKTQHKETLPVKKK